ncbi:Attractin [Amphibalanus amphitrite]|uniref:Attractin n=1 Tax=Amphibalanus amphitrite TaxID=1232801 RepID=A0A6A4VB92_AMPAM|nr:Attractin [Amphibalanus amphitrite]KAF0293567.1 Attractin [Amphibalanus amphitrite]
MLGLVDQVAALAMSPEIRRLFVEMEQMASRPYAQVLTRLFVEMEQMASRPYAQVLLELSRRVPPSTAPQPAVRRRHRPVPCPIVLEQCAGNRAALITVVIEGPTGGHQFAPAGVSGINVGTALVADGSSRKDSVDRSHKADSRKALKTTLTPGSDVCV